MLAKAYDPASTEDNIYKMWEKSGAFKADSSSDKESFTVSMPLPNATGQLHLGHSVMLSLQDIFTRFNRMRGREALWVPGTDHAAIATENVVIKMIQEKEGVADPRATLGREDLLKRIVDYVKRVRGQSVSRYARWDPVATGRVKRTRWIKLGIDACMKFSKRCMTTDLFTEVIE